MTTARISFLRCRNGNGKIFNNAEICPNSHLDKYSEISGDSSVWDSHLYSSKSNNSTIIRSSLYQSEAINALISGAIIHNSLIGCELVSTRQPVQNSKIFGHSRITGFAKLENVAFKNLTVSGNAVLKNWIPDGDEIFDGLRGYISQGVWERPPRVIRLTCDLTITESVPGFAFVGCQHRSISDWLKFGERIGLVFGVTKRDVSNIRKFLKSL